jgi:hypothetical protein
MLPLGRGRSMLRGLVWLQVVRRSGWSGLVFEDILEYVSTPVVLLD